MVSKLDPSGESSSFEFLNIRSEAIQRIEKLSRIRILGYQFPASRWPDNLERVYLNGDNVYISNLKEHVSVLFPQVPRAIRDRALEFVEILDYTSAIYVPLVHNENIIGSVAVWGETISKDDLAAFSVFASQLANALENARLVFSEQEKTLELEHSNELLNVLSEVAIEITSVKGSKYAFSRYWVRS